MLKLADVGLGVGAKYGGDGVGLVEGGGGGLGVGAGCDGGGVGAVEREGG